MTQQKTVGFFRLAMRDAHNMPNVMYLYRYYRGNDEADVLLQLNHQCSKNGVLEALTITQEEYESNTQIQEQ